MQIQRPRTAKISVSGLVQGVGYRYFVLDAAKVLGIKGYVRNLSGGAVEVVARGDKSTLLDFIERLKQGPAFSRVDRVQVEYVEAGDEYESFGIRF